MTIAEQISRITTASNIIKNKTVELGLSKDSTTDGDGLVSVSDLIGVHARAFAKISAKESGTITPGLDDKVIEGFQFLAGDQTIKGVGLDVDSSKIVRDKTVKIMSNGLTVTSITGTLDLNYFTTGTTEPTADYGEDGDMYLMDAPVVNDLAVNDNETLVFQSNGETQDDGLSLNENDSLTSKTGFSLDENDSLVLN